MTVPFQPTRENDFMHASYDYRGRFLSYWQQIHEITRRAGVDDRLLEIGPGNHFMTDYLRKRGYRVETLDLDDHHRPDHVGSVTAIPLPDRAVEMVVCFQVLEHLPFEAFTPALQEMARVANRHVLFSVPDVRYFLELDLSLFSSQKRFHRVLSFPRLTSRALPPQKPGGHLWEVGRTGFPVGRILAAIPPELRRTDAFRVPGNPIHHMVLLDVVR